MAPSQECVKLSSKVLLLGLSSVVFGTLSTGAATSAGIFSKNDLAVELLSGGAALTSLVGGVTSYLNSFYSAQYTKNCQ